MKTITIEASIYNKISKRLVVSLLDENGNGSGLRIKGAKFNYFDSDHEIVVPLTIQEAKDLISEVQKLVDELESEVEN